VRPVPWFDLPDCSNELLIWGGLWAPGAAYRPRAPGEAVVDTPAEGEPVR
jgi:hypothetical protein